MLMKQALLTKLHSSEVTVALATAITRLNLQDTMSDIVKIIYDHIDESLTSLWQSAKRRSHSDRKLVAGWLYFH